MIQVKNLLKNYGRVRALDGITFSVPKGQILGLLGPNGAGKTTAMKILTCFLNPTSGTAKVAGFDVLLDSVAVRERVGYLPENAPLYREMLVKEYLNFIAEVRKIPSMKRQARLDEITQECGIGSVLGRPIGELSKGFCQRVGLAQAMLHQPDILILDEPTTGLDPNQIMEIRQLIKNIGKEKTVVLSTHILPEVEATCDRVLIINRGRIVADNTPEDLRRGDMVIASIQGPEGEIPAALERIPGILKVEAGSAKDGFTRLRIKTDGSQEVSVAIFKMAAEKGWILSELKSEDTSLEEVFKQLTAV